MIKFGYTINYVADVKETITFFENAFGMKCRFTTPENDYGELDTGETVLAFASHELAKSNLPNGYISCSDSTLPLGTEIALITDKITQAHQQAISCGASELKAPETKPWGQTVSYLRCPAGVLLELCTPIQP